MKKLISTTIFAFFLVSVIGCGYKPTTTYTKKYVSGDVFADVAIDISNPEISVVLKDALNNAILSKFDAQLVSYEKSNTQLYGTLSGVSMTPLQYDSDGYVSVYRANATVTLQIVQKTRTSTFTQSGYYDFSVSTGAISSDTQRIEAIKEASAKALDNIIAAIIHAAR